MENPVQSKLDKFETLKYNPVKLVLDSFKIDLQNFELSKENLEKLIEKQLNDVKELFTKSLTHDGETLVEERENLLAEMYRKLILTIILSIPKELPEEINNNILVIDLIQKLESGSISLLSNEPIIENQKIIELFTYIFVFAFITEDKYKQYSNDSERLRLLLTNLKRYAILNSTNFSEIKSKLLSDIENFEFKQIFSDFVEYFSDGKIKESNTKFIGRNDENELKDLFDNLSYNPYTILELARMCL